MNPQENESTTGPSQDIQDLEPSTLSTSPNPQQASQTPVNSTFTDAPNPSVSPMSVTNQDSQPFFKKWWPALAGGAILLLALVGAGIGFAMYQKPENVLLSAVSNAMNAKTLDAKSVITSTQTGSELKTISTIKASNNGVQFDGAFTATTAGKDTTFDTSVIFTKDNVIYVKLGQLNNIAKTFIGDNQQALKAYKPVIDKVDNKWIRLTKQDLGDIGVPTMGLANGSTKCTQTLVSTIQSDKNQQNKLVELFKKHPFVKVSKQLADQTINGMDSFHYQLTSNSSQLKPYAEGLKQIDIFQNYEKCSGQKISVSDQDLKDSSSSANNFEAWVGKWNHTFTRIGFSSEQKGNKGSFTFDPTFNGPVDIKAPTGATPIKDLLKQIQDTFSQTQPQ